MIEYSQCDCKCCQKWTEILRDHMKENKEEIERLTEQLRLCNIDNANVEAEISRLVDGIYSMCVGFEDQARKMDAVTWLKTRLIHVEKFNETVMQFRVKVINILKEVAEIHDVDEYGKHSNDCLACRAEKLIQDLANFPLE